MLTAVSRFVAPKLTKTVKLYKILSLDLGHYNSIRTLSSVDRHGNPLPWYTYPAIEYLKQLNLTEKTVFEFGLGNSTLFWAARAKHVTTIENDRKWFERIKQICPANVSCHLAEDRDAYINFIKTVDGTIDIIVIDGLYRRACAEAAIERLSDEGFIILDNSDWCQKSAALLRSHDLIEVDMAGFVPINNYASTTSFFLRRGVKLAPARDVQPVPSIGSSPITQAQADLEEEILDPAAIGRGGCGDAEAQS